MVERGQVPRDVGLSVNTMSILVSRGGQPPKACTTTNFASSLLLNVMYRLLLWGTYDQMTQTENSWWISYSHPNQKMKKNRRDQSLMWECRCTRLTIRFSVERAWKLHMLSSRCSTWYTDKNYRAIKSRYSSRPKLSTLQKITQLATRSCQVFG